MPAFQKEKKWKSRKRQYWLPFKRLGRRSRSFQQSYCQALHPAIMHLRRIKIWHNKHTHICIYDKVTKYKYFFSWLYHKSKSILWQDNPFLYHRIWEIKRHNLVIQFSHNSSQKKSTGHILQRSFYITAGGSRWCQVHDAEITAVTSFRKKGLKNIIFPLHSGYSRDKNEMGHCP